MVGATPTRARRAGVTSLGRFAVGLGLALTFAVVAATPVWAHATLISSEPGNGEVLATPPAQVVLEFDVPVNPILSQVTMRDRAGRLLPGVAVDAASGISNELVVELPSLPPQGEYHLYFQARDDTDLHQTRGEVVFGVGEPAESPGDLVSAPGPSYLESGSRWLDLAGTCLLVGIVAVWLGILPAASRRRPVMVSARGRLLSLATLGYAAIVLGKAGQLFVTAASLSTRGMAGWLDAARSALTAGRFGVLWLAGMGLAALVLLTVRAGVTRPRWHVGSAAMVLSTLVLVAVSTLTSHGENQSGVDLLVVAIRIVHLASAGLWVGGLSVLVFLFAGALRGGSPDGSAALVAFRRFTGLAFIAVGLLTSSGLLLAARGVQSAAALVTTAYGLTLVAKLLAGAAAIGLGVRHTLILSPPRGAGVGGPVKLARSMPFEVGTMLLVLWGAATLGATAPASVVSPSSDQLEAKTMTRVDDLTVRTSMNPAQQGVNTLIVQTSEPTSTHGPITLVQIVLTQPHQAAQTVTGHTDGGGRYEFPSVSVAAAGVLTADVAITRADGQVEHVLCTWAVLPPAQAPAGLADTPWAPFLQAVSMGIVVAMLAGVATWLVLEYRRRRGRDNRSRGSAA